MDIGNKMEIIDRYLKGISTDDIKSGEQIRKRITECLDDANIEANDKSADKEFRTSVFNEFCNFLLLYLARNKYPFPICEYAILATKLRGHSDKITREMFVLYVASYSRLIVTQSTIDALHQVI